MSLNDRIPGYWAAVAAEASARDAAFLERPQVVAGVVVRPMTLRDYLRLNAEQSPFVCGGLPDRGDVAFLLWHQRPAGAPTDEPALEAFRGGFDALDLDWLIAAVAEFTDRALRDRPTGNPGRSGAVVGSGAMFVHSFMRTYPSMGKDDVLDLPLEQLWGLYRCIQLERDPRALFSNPLSDRVRGEYQRQRQEARAATAAKEAKRAAARRANTK